MSESVYDAIIVGGGVSGICSAIRLRQDLGLSNVLIIERAARFGGTWQANQYPGCGCDVPTRLYSLSFEQRKKWDAFFSSQVEIAQYMQAVAEKHGLDKKTAFSHEAKRAVFSQESATWSVEVQDVSKDEKGAMPAARTLTCRVLISGMGALSVPRSCGVKGAETFQGPLFHSARWDHSADLTDKNVVILGNGCSASQIIPRIAPKVKQLTQVVRSKHWVSPQLSDPFKPFRLLETYLPGFTKIERLGVALFLESHFIQADKKWGEGARRRYAKVCRKYVESCAPSEYHDMLLPRNDEVQVACKRRIFDDGYIPSLCRKNVELTNDQVVEIKPRSVLLANGREVPCDVLIHANGFHAETFSLQMDIVGPNGSLSDYWKSTSVPQAYRGTLVSGFPNLFLIWGPNTVTGHFSAIWTIEACVDLMVSALRPCFASDAKKTATVCVGKAAEDKEQEYIEHKMKDKIYSTGCGAWYTDKDTGRVTALAPCTQTTWQTRCRYPVMADFVYSGTNEKRSAASYLPLKKRLGVALSRGALPDYANQSALMKPIRAVSHAVAMTSYQASSWAFDTLFGWEYPEPYNRK